MELPEALKFRNNTGNRAYGFEQTLPTLVEQKLTHASSHFPDGDFPYNYSVAGNNRNTA